MTKLHFEKNLPHQTKAVESTLAVFDDVPLHTATGLDKDTINPEFQTTDTYVKNITTIQAENQIEQPPKKDSNIIDIMMETGTGKTYTYTKTMFELNK